MTTSTYEIESFIVIKDMADLKRKLEGILKKYGVDAISQIEEKIQDGQIPEHPAYEDYLDALSFQQAIEDMKSVAKRLIEDF